VAEHHTACAQVADGEALECEYRMRHSDGQWRWLHSRDVAFARDENGAVTEILGFCQDVTGRKHADDALIESNVRLERMVYDVAEAMGRVIEVRDPYTRGHQERVARISKAIAVEMGLPENDVKAVEMAALVHDIGKLSVPAEILSMPRALTSLEFSLIQEHPTKGYEILKDIDFPWPIADIVLQHHERLDGSGYPAGLRDETLLPARVLTVADVVEAMASHRPYRAALGLPCAMAELKEHPEKYDPTVVAACVRLRDRGEIEL
jgi:putative nucleotidyltransferase with HDIG domain